MKTYLVVLYCGAWASALYFFVRLMVMFANDRKEKRLQTQKSTAVYPWLKNKDGSWRRTLGGKLQGGIHIESQGSMWVWTLFKHKKVVGQGIRISLATAVESSCDLARSLKMDLGGKS